MAYNKHGRFDWRTGIAIRQTFKVDVAEYIPFLAIGFVLWQLISGILLDGCNVFVQSEGIIKQIKLPLSLHIYRVIWRNFLTLLHNSVVVVFVMVYFNIGVNLNTLLALVGIFFLCHQRWLVLFLIGMLCARYRDLKPHYCKPCNSELFFDTNHLESLSNS